MLSMNLEFKDGDVSSQCVTAADFIDNGYKFRMRFPGTSSIIKKYIQKVSCLYYIPIFSLSV